MTVGDQDFGESLSPCRAMRYAQVSYGCNHGSYEKFSTWFSLLDVSRCMESSVQHSGWCLAAYGDLGSCRLYLTKHRIRAVLFI